MHSWWLTNGIRTITGVSETVPTNMAEVVMQPIIMQQNFDLFSAVSKLFSSQ